MGEIADLDFDRACIEEAQYHHDLMNSKSHYEYFNKNKSMKVGDKGVATVTAIQQNGTWNKQDGTLMYKQEVTLKSPTGNEATFQANSKNPETPYKIGDLVEYKITKEYNGSFSAGISKQREQNNGGGKYQKPSEKEKYPSFALAYANQYYFSVGIDEIDSNSPEEVANHVTGLADKYLKWLNENSK